METIAVNDAIYGGVSRGDVVAQSGPSAFWIHSRRVDVVEKRVTFTPLSRRSLFTRPDHQVEGIVR